VKPERGIAEREDSTITLVAVGDTMLADSPECLGRGVGSMILRYGPEFPFRYVVSILRDADITFANLESVVSGPDGWMSSRRIQMQMNPIAISGLRYAGFNVVSLANNHAMQHGKEGLLKTIALLRGQNIESVGVESPDEGIHNRYAFTKGDIRVCLLGYNCRPPKYSTAPLYTRGDLHRMIRDIQSVREESDVVVLSLHWGEEFVECPSPAQVRIAHELIDAGAHLILGHHPHILQGIEQYGNGLVAYSLGNFVFDLWQTRLRETIIFKARFSKEKMVDFKVIPAVINDFHQPELLDDDVTLQFLDGFAELSSSTVSREYSHSSTAEERYDILVKRRSRQFRREVYLRYLQHLREGNSKTFFMNLLAAVLRRLLRIRNK